MEHIQKVMAGIIKKKLRGKTVKRPDGGSVKENYEIVDVAIPKVGSVNIYGKNFGEVKKPVTKKKKKTTIDVDSNVCRVIEQAVQENVHSVTSATSITFSNGQYETPLGPLTTDHIVTSRIPLDALKLLMGLSHQEAGDEVEDEITRLNNLYFSLIPHRFGRKITHDDQIRNFDDLADEYDILDQLESAVNLGDEMSDTAAGILESLKLKLVPTSKKEFSRLYDKFENTRASNHANLRDWGVKNVYDLELKTEKDRYKKRNVKGEKMELFHGSRNCNILSIMSSGLMVPRVAAHGRMFGDGIYAAPASTKALNYSTGFWGGKNKFPNAFIFIVEFSLGQTHYPKRSMWGGPPTGSDSVWAKASDSGLYNDEVIVYATEQCTITHIMELERR